MIATEWHPTKNEKGPHEYFEMSNSKVWWLCPDCENEYHAWISNRVNVESGCPSCHGGALHSDGRNSLAVVAPEVAAEWHPTKNKGLTPDKIRPSSGISAWWLCAECGHEWKTSPNHRVDGEGNAKSGCSVCAQTGFDPSKPGTYYVIEIRNEEGAVILYKGGKTGDIERRLSNHKRRFSKHQRSSGWTLQLFETVDFEIGMDAQNIEGMLLGAADIRAPHIEDLSSELFLHNPLDYAREMGWVNQRGAL